MADLITSNSTALPSGTDSIAPSEKVTKLNTDQLLVVWKTVIDVQQHFNDISMKIRTLYFTILAAAMGLFGVLQDRSWVMDALNCKVSLPMVLIFALIPISLLFYFLDKHWYHRLLKGAVDQGIEIETAYGNALPEIRLGAQIARTSPLKINGRFFQFWFSLIVSDSNFKKNKNLHSDGKIEVLYKSVILLAVLSLFVYAIFGGIRVGGQPFPLFIWSLIRHCQ